MTEQQNQSLTEKPTSAAAWLAQFQSIISNEIEVKQHHGLSMPKNYNAQNALEGIIIAIKGTVDTNKKPALSVCTADSIKHAVYETLTKGLDPGHKQCYYIVYGTALTMFESYFGWILRAMRADENILKINSQVVFKSDKFGYELINGVKCNVKHTQDPDAVDSEIRGAYCIILYKDGSNVVEYMPMAEIKRSWARGPMKGNSDAHKESPGEMAKRTVIKRLLKNVVNTTSNGVLLADAMDEIEEEQDKAEAVKDITPPDMAIPASVQANPETGEVIDVQPPAKPVTASKKQTELPPEPEGIPVEQSLFGDVPDALKQGECL